MTILTLYIAEFGPFFRWNIPNFYFIFRLFCYSNLCKTWKSCRNPLSKLYRLNEYCHLLCRKTTVFRCLKTPWKYRLGTRFFGWFHSYMSYYTDCYSLFFFVVFSSLYGPQPFLWGASFGGVRCCSACLHYGLQYVFCPFMCHLDCSGYLHFEASVKALEGVWGVGNSGAAIPRVA